MKKLLLILVVLMVVGLLVAPAGAEPAELTTRANGVTEVGDGIALAPAGTPQATLAYVAKLYPAKAETGPTGAGIGPIAD